MNTRVLSVVCAVAVCCAHGLAQQQKYIKWDGNVPFPIQIGPNPPTVLQIDVPPDVDGLDIIQDLNVDFIIEYPRQGNLRITLTGPAAGPVIIMDQAGFPWVQNGFFGFQAANFGNPATGAKFTLDDSAAGRYDSAPFGLSPDHGITNVTGSWIPDNALAAFNGTSKVGRWTFVVEDMFNVDNPGAILNLGLQFHNTKIPSPGAMMFVVAMGCGATRRRR